MVCKLNGESSYLDVVQIRKTQLYDLGVDFENIYVKNKLEIIFKIICWTVFIKSENLTFYKLQQFQLLLENAVKMIFLIKLQ